MRVIVTGVRDENEEGVSGRMNEWRGKSMHAEEGGVPSRVSVQGPLHVHVLDSDQNPQSSTAAPKSR